MRHDELHRVRLVRMAGDGRVKQPEVAERFQPEVAERFERSVRQVNYLVRAYWQAGDCGLVLERRRLPINNRITAAV